MKRRDVIKLGAVVAGAGVGVPGCAVPKLLGSLHGEDGAAAFNAILDEQLGKLEGPGLLHKIVEGRAKKKLSAETSAKIAEQDAMFRRMLSTVLITQAFRELPVETQVEPAVQTRMWRHYDQIGSTIFEISDMLASLDAKQRAQVRSTLQEQPDLAMELGEQLDARAARAGMSTTRRLQLRKMMSQTAFRLKSGHASSMIDEYATKVEKLRTTDERNAAAIDLTSKLGERAFWRHQQRLAQAPGAPPAPTAGSAPSPPPGPAQPAQPGAPQPPAPADPASVPPSATPTVPPPQQPMHVLLHKSARSAARRGDCRALEVLGNRVQELDAEYHRTAFQTDPLIAACRPGVTLDAAGNLVLQPVPDASAAQTEDVKPPPHPGSKAISAGGYMFGIGLIAGLGGALLLAADVFIGVIGITAAVILVGLGLLVMLIGAIVYAAND